MYQRFLVFLALRTGSKLVEDTMGAAPPMQEKYTVHYLKENTRTGGITSMTEFLKNITFVQAIRVIVILAIVIIFAASILYNATNRVNVEQVRQQVEDYVEDNNKADQLDRTLQGKAQVKVTSDKVRIYLGTANTNEINATLSTIADELGLTFRELVESAEIYPLSDLRASEEQRGDAGYGGNREDVSDLID